MAEDDDEIPKVISIIINFFSINIIISIIGSISIKRFFNYDSKCE